MKRDYMRLRSDMCRIGAFNLIGLVFIFMGLIGAFKFGIESVIFGILFGLMFMLAPALMSIASMILIIKEDNDEWKEFTEEQEG